MAGQSQIATISRLSLPQPVSRLDLKSRHIRLVNCRYTLDVTSLPFYSVLSCNALVVLDGDVTFRNTPLKIAENWDALVFLKIEIVQRSEFPLPSSQPLLYLSRYSPVNNKIIRFIVTSLGSDLIVWLSSLFNITQCKISNK